MKRYNLLLLISIYGTCLTHQIDTTLAKYQHYLDEGTFVGWPNKPKPLSRFHTFKTAFNYFENNRGKVIVELGTSRSFVHGGHIGCNKSDSIYWHPHNPEDWDWGAGFFTRMACECLAHLKPEFHTVDIASAHIQRCKIMTQDFNSFMQYHVMSSLDFLKNFNKKIDLLYLDTGDMTPIEQTAQLQLAEAKIIVERNLISSNGIILIDDVKNPTPEKYGETSGLGKSKYAIPYLLSHGFIVLEDEYQVILKKSH